MRTRLMFFAVLLLLAIMLSVASGQENTTAQYTGPTLTAGRETVPEGIVPATLTLSQAIAIALQYNPQVAASLENVNATQAQVTQATSLLLPRLEVSASRSTPVDLPAFSFQSRDSSWETDFTLSQPLYTGGGLRAGIAAARSYLKGQEGSHERTRQEIAYTVRRNYYAVLSAEDGVSVAQQVVNSAAETLRVARLRYEAGVAPQFDVLSAEARVARVEQGLITARVQKDTSWAQFATTLGVPILSGTTLVTPPPTAAVESSEDAFRAEALQQRPDLTTAEGNVAAARAQLAVAKSARQPSVAAAASYALREQTTISGDLLGSPGTDIIVSQNSGTIALVASYSLFNGGEVEAQVEEARARLRAAENLTKSAKQQIELEVRSSYLALDAANAQVEAARKEVTQAQEAYRVATIRYEEGVGTSIEILSAEADLAGAKTRLISAVFERNLAFAALDLAVGRNAEVATEAAGE